MLASMWFLVLYVLRKPLAERSYLRHYGLRSTAAWIIAHLANIQVPDVDIFSLADYC